MATIRHNKAVSPRSGERQGELGDNGGETALQRPAGDGESFMDEIQVLLNGLVSFPRTLRLYPSHHQRITKHAARLERLAKRMLRSAGGALELRVRADEVYANEILLDGPEQLLSEFALLLRGRAVRALVLHRGIEAKEFTSVGEWFAHVAEGSTATDTQAALDSISHPRLDIVLVGQAAQRSRAAALVLGDGNGRFEGLDVVIHDVLSQPSIARRLERLRTGANVHSRVDMAAGQPIDEILVAFFGRLDWTSLPPKVFEATVRGFLGRISDLVEGVGDTDAAEGPVSDAAVRALLDESLEGALAVADAQDGLFQSSSMMFADASRDEIAYEKLDLAELERHGMPAREKAHAYLNGRHDEHCVMSASLLVEAELLLRAEAEHHRPRRARLEKRLARRDLPADGVARALSELNNNAPDPSPCDWPVMVREVAAGLGSHEALAQLLGLLASDTESAQLLTDRLARRRDAFDILAGLMQLRLPEIMRQLVVDTLIQQARTGVESWITWCFEHPRVILNEYVFGVLMIKAADLLAPVTQRILAKGARENQRELARLLTANGSETALRLLVGRAADSADGPGRVVIDALGGFKHELAVSALCDIVHRCNTEKQSGDKARRALIALKRIGTPDAVAFLGNVLTGRRGLLRRFRKDIRAAAREVLDERWSPCGQQ